ncbi:carbohydrate binding domain-containing protein [Actinokineospora inagensis]|uniref:carbohydrate binding domain-containing protein n=1 Tax=Actinokineospora inagensis TaxID=103730 RepID=UPI0004273904|nr:carbohydrate binding domain-containing protein [Actinokineospora inagensis]
MRTRHRLLAGLSAVAFTVLGLVVAPTTAEAANLLSNPGLESGSLSPWTCSAGAGSVVGSPVHGGSKALAGAATGGDIARCAQTVAVKPSTTYSLSVWVRGNFVNLGVTGGASRWTYAADYAQLGFTFTTTASQTTAEIYIHGWYGQGTYYADDFVLDGPGGGGGDTQPPTTPGNPRVTGVTSNSVSLAWDASTDDTGVVGYDVVRDGQATAVTGTSATVGGLSPSTAYSFTVRARDAAGNVSTASAPVSATTSKDDGPGDPGPRFIQAAPYVYLGWGNPPTAPEVMKPTGVKWFTMAFILAQNGCSPSWDSQRPLTGGADETFIKAVRANGGDVVPSIGGWSGNKLGPNCSTPEALAGAYQKVIDAYKLKAVDVDIENTDEFEAPAVQDRILSALKIVKAKNPGFHTILTMPTLTTGPNSWGNRLIEQAKALNADIDNFTIMPFDFGGGADMYGNTINATEGLKTKLKSTFGWTDAQAYAHIGISGMNNQSDQGENTTPEIWTKIRDWGNSHHIGRFTYWAVNRDRPNWQFTSITAGFTG